MRLLTQKEVISTLKFSVVLRAFQIMCLDQFYKKSQIIV